MNRVVQVYLNEMFCNDVLDIGVESQEKRGVVVIEGDLILISERLCDKEETPVVLHDISLITNVVLSGFVQKLLEALLCVPRGGGGVGIEVQKVGFELMPIPILVLQQHFPEGLEDTWDVA